MFSVKIKMNDDSEYSYSLTAFHVLLVNRRIAVYDKLSDSIHPDAVFDLRDIFCFSIVDESW